MSKSCDGLAIRDRLGATNWDITDAALEKAIRTDEEYQALEKLTTAKIFLLGEIGLSHNQRLAVDRALTATNEPQLSVRKNGIYSRI